MELVALRSSEQSRGRHASLQVVSLEEEWQWPAVQPPRPPCQPSKGSTHTPHSRWHRPPHHPLLSPAAGPWRTRGPPTLTKGGAGKERGRCPWEAGMCSGGMLSLSASQQTQPVGQPNPTAGGPAEGRDQRAPAHGRSHASICGLQRPGPNGRRQASVQMSGEGPRNRTHPRRVGSVSRSCHWSPPLQPEGM